MYLNITTAKFEKKKHISQTSLTYRSTWSYIVRTKLQIPKNVKTERICRDFFIASVVSLASKVLQFLFVL